MSTQFEITNSFPSVTSGHGGACIYVQKGIETREVNYFQNMNEEKNFEMAAIELSECKITVVCVCVCVYIYIYSETCIRQNRTGPKIFSTLEKFPHYTKLQQQKC
jgi:hypothetical protein